MEIASSNIVLWSVSLLTAMLFTSLFYIMYYRRKRRLGRVLRQRLQSVTPLWHFKQTPRHGESRRSAVRHWWWESWLVFLSSAGSLSFWPSWSRHSSRGTYHLPGRASSSGSATPTPSLTRSSTPPLTRTTTAPSGTYSTSSAEERRWFSIMLTHMIMCI